MRGFSLVELSIVLVILGLLVGGILAGQSMIRAAELRSVSADSSKMMTAYNAFRDKYIAIPGDIKNATAFWGIAGGTTGNDSTCKNTVNTDAKTCNGDGNGQIDNSTGSVEITAMWKHLANAGLIEGAYQSGAVASPIPGVHLPMSRLDSTSGWYIQWSGVLTASASQFDGNYGNTMNLYKRPTPVQGVLTPEEAWNLDTKMDDGKPGQGKVYANWSDTFSPATVKCTTATNSTDKLVDYNLTSKTKDCGLSWLNL